MWRVHTVVGQMFTKKKAGNTGIDLATEIVCSWTTFSLVAIIKYIVTRKRWPHFQYPSVSFQLAVIRGTPLWNRGDMTKYWCHCRCTESIREVIEVISCSLHMCSYVMRICANCSVSHPLLAPPASSSHFHPRKPSWDRENGGNAAGLDRQRITQISSFHSGYKYWALLLTIGDRSPLLRNTRHQFKCLSSACAFVVIFLEWFHVFTAAFMLR